MDLRLFARSAPRRVAHVLPIVYEAPVDYSPLLLTAFGALFGGVLPLAALLGHVRNDTGIPTLVFLTPFAAFGLGVAWLGLALFLRRERFTVSAASVSFRVGGIWGATAWDEPLSAFRGVLAQEIERNRRRGGDDDPSYTEYRVVLRHAHDRKKDLVLFSARTGTEMEAETEDLSKLLGVPVLRESAGGGYEMRAPGELDKSLAQRVREGALASPADPGSAPPAGKLRRERGDDGAEVLVGPIGGAPAFWIGLVLAATAALALLLFKSVFLFLMSALLAAVFLAFGLGEEALSLGADVVRLEYRLGSKRLTGTTLLRGGIKDVFLLRTRGSTREVVRVVGAEGQLDMGQGITDDERRWLKDYLLSRLSRP